MSAAPDVVVIGSGLIGLSAAAALAESGQTVVVIGEPRAGEASPAAAGLLAPSVEEVSAGHAFALASRDRYPSYISWLSERTGFRVPLNRNGVLEVALDEHQASTLAANSRAGGQWFSSHGLSDLEPALRHAVGGFLYPDDGAVDNVALIRALAALLEAERRVTRVLASATAIDPAGSVVMTSTGDRISAGTIVIAAGAWATAIAGLPRSLPIEPVRGQMVSADSAILNRPVFGEGIYLVPRDTGWTVIGSTMERVGFDASTTDDGLDQLRRAATRLCPPLTGSDMSEAWAGLRPVTPDLLPIIDRDPDHRSLLYACGHSRNGILMAPLTADCIALMAAGKSPSHDISPFSLSRFSSQVSR